MHPLPLLMQYGDGINPLTLGLDNVAVPYTHHSQWAVGFFIPAAVSLETSSSHGSVLSLLGEFMLKEQPSTLERQELWMINIPSSPFE